MSQVWKFFLSFVIFVAVCYGGLVWFVDHEVGKGIDQAVLDTKGMSLTYKDLSVSITNHTVTLTDVAATLPDGRSLTADTVIISRFDQANHIPYYAAGKATGVTMQVTPANFGTWATPLNVAGVTSMTGDINLDYSYDAKAESLTINLLEIKADGLGDIEFTGTVNHLDLSQLRMEKLVGLRIAKADLTFTNGSIMDTMVNNAAQGLGTSQADARARVCAEITAMADYAHKNDNTVAENALRGLKRFVNEPGTITLSARPAEPVPVLYFFMGRDFYDNLRLLGVSVTTDAGDDI